MNRHHLARAWRWCYPRDLSPSVPRLLAQTFRVQWGRPTLVIRDVDANELFFWPHDDFSNLGKPAIESSEIALHRKVIQRRARMSPRIAHGPHALSLNRVALYDTCTDVKKG